MNGSCPLSNVWHCQAFVRFGSDVEILSTNVSAGSLGHVVDALDDLTLVGEGQSIFFVVALVVVVLVL
jgi:hypothetical protein